MIIHKILFNYLEDEDDLKQTRECIDDCKKNFISTIFIKARR